MIQITLILAGVAIVLGGGFFMYVRYARQKMARLKDGKREAVNANKRLQKEIQQRDHVIKRMQEVENESGKTKREIRDHDSARDRANAATNVMQDIAGGGDKDGDERSEA